MSLWQKGAARPTTRTKTAPQPCSRRFPNCLWKRSREGCCWTRRWRLRWCPQRKISRSSWCWSVRFSTGLRGITCSITLFLRKRSLTPRNIPRITGIWLSEWRGTARFSMCCQRRPRMILSEGPSRLCKA